MVRGLMMLLIAAVLTVSLAGVAGAQYQAPPGEYERQGWEERRHAIHEAIRELERTRSSLERLGGHDFGGHRGKAIVNIERALEELRMAIHPDRR